MKLEKKYLIFCTLIGLILSSSCKEYLSEKPLKSSVVPVTMEDLEALLNARWNVESSSAANEILSDNYYVDTDDWQDLMSRAAITPAYGWECLSYCWDERASHQSWQDAYTHPIYYSNVVLDVAKDIKTKDQTRLNKIKGSALFYRSLAFERLAQVFCKPHSSTSLEDLGLVLRLTSDINEPTKRASVAETYDQITNDLKEASDLLPNTSEFPTHPTKAAAYGALARVYLSMRDYQNAGYYADLCLKIKDDIMDYNDIDPTGRPVFREYNEEVIFHNRPVPSGILAASKAKISPDLYESYDEKDLRKSLFFLENTGENSGTFHFRGSYLGKFDLTGINIFDGITVGEMYLIRAESFARAGNKELALLDLNTLLIKRRVNDGTWVPVSVIDANEALQVILDERRKELVYRGLRWADLRRLNEEGANISLKRVLGNVTYTLSPGDLRWTLLIPDEVIERSNIEQNPR